MTNNETTNLQFEVSSSQNLKLEFPKIYYKGYTLTKEGVGKTEIEKNKYGLIIAEVQDGNYTLKYTGTFAYNAAKILRLCYILVAVIIVAIVYVKAKKVGMST